MTLQPHQLKKVPTDQWSIREKLALASSVERTRDQNWVSVSRQIKSFAEPNRPPDWFSQKNCALQYGFLLENVEHPKRKRGEEIATPGSLIVKKLKQERIAELEKLIIEGHARHHKLRKELDLITAGRMDDKIDELIDELNLQAEEKARQDFKHHKWLKDREMEAERQRHLRLHMLAAQKTKKQTRTISDASDSMQSDDSNLPAHSVATPESPLPPQPPAASSLLTSLLRSPSNSPNQSPRTSHGPGPISVAQPPSQSVSVLQLPQALSQAQRSQSADSQQPGSGTSLPTPTTIQSPTLSKPLDIPPGTPSSAEDKKPVVTIKTEIVQEIKQEIIEDAVEVIEQAEAAESTQEPKVEAQVQQPEQQQRQTSPEQQQEQQQQQQAPQQAQEEQKRQPQDQQERHLEQQQCTSTDRELDDALSVMVDVANGNQPSLEAVVVEEVPDSEIVSYIDEMRQDMEQGKVQPTVEAVQRKQMIAAQLRQSAEEVVAAKSESEVVTVVQSQVKQEPVETPEELLLPPLPSPRTEQETIPKPVPEEVQTQTTSAGSNPPSRESTPAPTRVPSPVASTTRQPISTTTTTCPAAKPSTPPSRASPAKDKDNPNSIKEKERVKMSIKIPTTTVVKEKVSTPPPKTPTKVRENAMLSKPREPEGAPAKTPQPSRLTPTKTTKRSDDEVPTLNSAITSSTTVSPALAPFVSSTETPVSTVTNEDRNEDTDDKSQCSSNTNAGDEAASGLDSQETESREDSVEGSSPSATIAADEEPREEAQSMETSKDTREAVVVVTPSEKEKADEVKDGNNDASNIVEEELVDEMIEEEVSEDEDLGPEAIATVDDREVAEQVFQNSRSKESTEKEEDTKDDNAVASPEEEEDIERAEERERDLKIWKKSALLVWRTAANHSHAGVFMTPVTDEMAPGYADIVYRPMDLTIVRRSIESGAIRTTLELLRDMMLMFQNAIMYNSADHDVYHKAIEMRLDVMKQIEEWMANEATEKGTGGSSPLLLGLGAVIGVKRAARHRHSEGVEVPPKKPRRSTGLGGAK